MPRHLDQHWEPDKIIFHSRENGKQKPWDSVAHGVKLLEPAPSRERSQPQRSVAQAELAFEQKYGNKLVIDDLSSHTAHDLCESETSAGPNFVNPEDGYFCDMQTKTIHPICKRQDGTAVCFDMEQNELGKLTQLRLLALV